MGTDSDKDKNQQTPCKAVDAPTANADHLAQAEPAANSKNAVGKVADASGAAVRTAMSTAVVSNNRREADEGGRRDLYTKISEDFKEEIGNLIVNEESKKREIILSVMGLFRMNKHGVDALNNLKEEKIIVAIIEHFCRQLAAEWVKKANKNKLTINNLTDEQIINAIQGLKLKMQEYLLPASITPKNLAKAIKSFFESRKTKETHLFTKIHDYLEKTAKNNSDIIGENPHMEAVLQEIFVDPKHIRTEEWFKEFSASCDPMGTYESCVKSILEAWTKSAVIRNYSVPNKFHEIQHTRFNDLKDISQFNEPERRKFFTKICSEYFKANLKTLLALREERIRIENERIEQPIIPNTSIHPIDAIIEAGFANAKPTNILTEPISTQPTEVKNSEPDNDMDFGSVLAAINLDDETDSTPIPFQRAAEPTRVDPLPAVASSPSNRIPDSTTTLHSAAPVDTNPLKNVPAPTKTNSGLIDPFAEPIAGGLLDEIGQSWGLPTNGADDSTELQRLGADELDEWTRALDAEPTISTTMQIGFQRVQRPEIPPHNMALPEEVMSPVLAKIASPHTGDNEPGISNVYPRIRARTVDTGEFPSLVNANVGRISTQASPLPGSPTIDAVDMTPVEIPQQETETEVIEDGDDLVEALTPQPTNSENIPDLNEFDVSLDDDDDNNDEFYDEQRVPTVAPSTEAVNSANNSPSGFIAIPSAKDRPEDSVREAFTGPKAAGHKMWLLRKGDKRVGKDMELIVNPQTGVVRISYTDRHNDIYSLEIDTRSEMTPVTKATLAGRIAVLNSNGEIKSKKEIPIAGDIVVFIGMYEFGQYRSFYKYIKKLKRKRIFKKTLEQRIESLFNYASKDYYTSLICVIEVQAKNEDNTDQNKKITDSDLELSVLSREGIEGTNELTPNELKRINALANEADSPNIPPVKNGTAN